MIDTLLLVSGEEAHAKGAEGARRAKRWLDSTTRANVQWVNPEPWALRKLTFQWADGVTYSFDLGGVLLGDELRGQEFLAESKYYKSALDQGGHYQRFLAGCYRAYLLRPDRCDNFLWITWSPFSVTSWDELRTPGYVRSAVLRNAQRALGVDTDAGPQVIDDDTCKLVADRLWMILLTDKQEKLTVSREHLGVIRLYDTGKGV